MIALDRVTKYLVQDRLDMGSWTPVFPGFGLTHVHNSGIAFSLFADGGLTSRIILHAVILIAVVVIGWMLVRQNHRGWMAGIGFGAILGGAVGNLIDRVLHGWVVDFIHVWVQIGGKMHSWPDFNIADSAITVGACMLIIHELRAGRSDDPPNENDASDTD